MGARIKKVRREQLAMTQLELANVLGIEPVNVSRWERDVAEPRMANLRELARISGVRIDWFFNGDEEQAA